MTAPDTTADPPLRPGWERPAPTVGSGLNEQLDLAWEGHLEGCGESSRETSPQKLPKTNQAGQKREGQTAGPGDLLQLGRLWGEPPNVCLYRGNWASQRDSEELGRGGGSGESGKRKMTNIGSSSALPTQVAATADQRHGCPRTPRETRDCQEGTKTFTRHQSERQVRTERIGRTPEARTTVCARFKGRISGPSVVLGQENKARAAQGLPEAPGPQRPGACSAAGAQPGLLG